MNKYQMKLEARKLLEEKLVALKKMMFDMFTDEYNAKFSCRNSYVKSLIKLYKSVLDDIDNMIEKYCKKEYEVKTKY